MSFDEEMAEEYYYENYPVTLSIGEEERKKAIINAFLAALKKGSQLDKVWLDYDTSEYSHKGKWVNRNSEFMKLRSKIMFKKFNFKNEYIHCIPSDESLIGKRVLFGDTWTDIKGQVESNNWTSCRRTLKSIDYESCCPFIIDNDFKTGQYKFIYYDPEWETEKVYYCYLLHKDEPEFIFDNEKPSSHVYAELTDYFEANEWCKKHDKFALEAKAWEEGKIIQCKNINGNWEDCEPKWDLNTEYRVKPDEEIYGVYIPTYFQRTPEFLVFKHSIFLPGGGIRYYEGTKSECENWIESHKKFKDLMYAWEYEDKIIQYYNSENEWHDCPDNNPFWDSNIEYRVKPDCVKCEDLKIGDIISDGKIDYMVLGLNHSSGSVSDVFLPCIGWRCDADLKNFYKK